MAEDGESGDTYIIKKIKKGGGHHGGAWKVAYADFVTAMMAFFLLLWLLNVTTEEQKNAISNYFDPTHPKVSQSESGAGGVLGGLSAAPEGAMVSTVQPITPQSISQAPPGLRGQPNQEPRESEEVIQKKAEEAERFDEAMEAIKKKIEEVPALADLAENLIVDMTPEGLRIQMVDSEGKSMFASGSAQMNQEAQLLIGTVSEIIKDLPNDVSVRGHTDSSGYGEGATYTNWELSADRANTTRRIMEQFGVEPGKVNNVVGKADTEHLFEDDPYDPRNRRISIILLKDEITNPPEPSENTGEAIDAAPSSLPSPMQPPPMGTFRRTPGEIEFP